MTVNELTKAQEDKIPEYFNTGIKFGLGTGSYDQQEVEDRMTTLYKAYGRKVPKFVHVASPKAGQEMAESGVNPVYGSQELYWLLYYKFINDELPVEKTDQPLDEMYEVCKLVGWFWPGDTTCVITPKPTELHMSGANRLHCTTGPALRWEDGFEVWALNGIRVTGHKDLMLQICAGQVPAKQILDIKNVEVRAEMIKVVGIDKLFGELKPTLMDTANRNDCDYELYSVDIYSDGSTHPRIYLKMPNPSVDEIHIEAVHPDCTTVDAALSWRNFGKFDLGTGQFVAPEVLT